MITEAALILVSCVLFVQAGLSDAIQETLHVKLRIASCPRCLTFWACLAWTLMTGHGLLVSVAASFITSYCAMWLCLAYDALALVYNYLYEQITQTPDTAPAPERAERPTDPSAGSDAVSQMP